MPRFFSLSEANAMLPELARLLPELQQQVAALAQVQEQLRAVRQTIHSNGHAAQAEGLGRQAEELETAIRAGFKQIEDWGIELRDLGRGLVDFPHRRGGRVVYLCWLLGEDEIGWWHETSSGFAGRQPIRTL